MDIVFDCPNCEQELAVDGSGAGTNIECPSCHENITIPEQSKKSVPATAPTPASSHIPNIAASSINTSAAAKVEMHLKVPVRDTPGERLIVKSKPQLEAVARGADKRLRSHTVRHSQCMEAGHDKFDDVITKFLNEVGEQNIIGMHTVSYTYFDITTQKLLNDYGFLIVFRG